MQVRNNKRYAAVAERGFAVEDVAKNVSNDIGNIDIIVHSLANGPEVKKPLLETSRQARYTPFFYNTGLPAECQISRRNRYQGCLLVHLWQILHPAGNDCLSCPPVWWHQKHPKLFQEPVQATYS